jgi:hypothetical protein
MSEKQIEDTFRLEFKNGNLYTVGCGRIHDLVLLFLHTNRKPVAATEVMVGLFCFGHCTKNLRFWDSAA